MFTVSARQIIIALIFICSCSNASSFIEANNPINYPVNPHEALLEPNGGNREFYSTNGKLDSAIYWVWDSIGQAWLYTTKSHYTWDAAVNLAEKEDFYWNGSTWSDTSKITYEYDVNNNPIAIREYKWENSSWDLRRYTVNTYDSLNNITLQTDSLWEVIFWKYYQYIYTYDANYNCTNVKRQLWNVTQWQNSQNTIYTYDVNNNMLTTVKQTWNLGWANQYRYVFTYDVNDYMTTFTFEQWDAGAWEGVNLYSYSYDVNYLLSGYTVGFWMGYWYTGHRYTITYNVDQKEVHRLFEQFDGSNWNNSEQYMYTYDINTDSSSKTDQVWRTTVWQNADSAHYYFSPLSGIPELNGLNFSLVTYPNPAYKYFTISSDEDLRNSVVQILDAAGRKIYSGFIHNAEQKIPCVWDTGIYFVQVKNNNRVGVVKIIVR